MYTCIRFMITRIGSYQYSPTYVTLSRSVRVAMGTGRLFHLTTLSLRREIKADVKKQHDLYVNNLVGDIKANTRDFYRYINGQKKDAQGIPPLRRNGNGVAESELEQADEFNGKFTDVYNKNEHSQVPLPNRSAPFMNDIVVLAVGITKLLKGLNPCKALGPDVLILES